MANDRFCCFRVHTIGMVLGWLGIIFSFIYVVGLSFFLAYLDEIVRKIIENGTEMPYEQLHRILLISGVVTLLLVSIHLVASILLLVGTVKNRHLLIVPWLVNAFFGIFYNVIILIVMISITVQNNLATPVPAIISTSLSIVFAMILWSAIYKLFTTIRNNTNMENTRLLSPASAPSYTRL